MTKQLHVPQRVYESLDFVNSNPTMFNLIEKNQAVRLFFEYAVDAKKKFLLPDGMTDNYKFDPAPYGMSAVNLNNEARRLYVFCRADLKPMQLEAMFVGLLAGITKPECELLIAVKDQNLLKIFPNLPIKEMAEMWNIPVTYTKSEVISQPKNDLEDSSSGLPEKSKQKVKRTSGQKVKKS